MTLILAMNKPEGLYVSVDYRVTKGGNLVDDGALKFLSVTYQPVNEPVSTLYAFTGIAQMHDGTPVGDWLRETIRGEMADSIDDSTKLVRERLDRDFPRRLYPYPLIVFILGHAADGRRFSGEINNYDLPKGRMRPKFRYQMEELDHRETAHVLASGSGAYKLLKGGPCEGLADQLRMQTMVRPRDPFEHMKLLATTNRRVAQHDNSVSPHCQVAFMTPWAELEPRIHVFTEYGEKPVPMAWPGILFGVDLTYQFQQSQAAFEAGQLENLTLDADEVKRHLQRRP